MKRRIGAVRFLIAGLLAAALCLSGCETSVMEESSMGKEEENFSSEEVSSETDTSEIGNQATAGESRIERVTYTITYDGTVYEKTADVYVPSSYDGMSPMNVLYLMHGSQGSSQMMSATMKPLFDRWIEEGKTQPMLVVFPTYYPDTSYVVPNYSEDYPLNHFFGTEEVMTLVKAVEGSYRTYAEGTDDEALSESRLHRAFGGYSMGGVTTWEVLAYQSPYVGYFAPMAGDCWLDRLTDENIEDVLTEGLEASGLTSSDFRIIAMVGGSDGTKYSMQPQIEALRENDPELFTQDSLIYWENEGGGHSQESMEIEVEHALGYLWTLHSA